MGGALAGAGHPWGLRRAGGGGHAEHGERPVAHLPAVAVGARGGGVAPHLAQAGEVREQQAHAVGEEEALRAQAPAALQRDLEAEGGRRPRRSGGDAGHAGGDGGHAVGGELLATEAEQLEGRRAVPGEEAVQVRRRAVEGLAGVQHEHPPPGPAEHEAGAQPGGAAADDDALPVLLRERLEGGERSICHSGSVRHVAPNGNTLCQCGKT